MPLTRPSASRREREQKSWRAVVRRMVSKSRRSAPCTGNGSRRWAGTIWSGKRGSSAAWRGQAGGVEQRRILWEGLRPVRRQSGKNFALAAQETYQAEHARMAEAAQQHLGNGRCELSVRGGEDFSAKDEVKIEAAHVAEGEEM